MACEDTRQLTEAQRQAAYQQQRTGVQRAVRPFTGTASLPNLIDYINRELMPAVKQARSAVNDVYLQVADNAPSANPLGYYFAETTAAADPTAGRAALNATPQSSATVLRISQTNGRLVDVLPWLDVMNGSVTEPLGVITLSDAINPGRFLRADLDTMTDQGAYWDLGITITEASHPSPFVEAEGVTLAFIPGVADNGGVGAQVPPGSITPMAADTFLGNITGAPASPVAVPLADVDSTSIAYDATSHTFQRAAMTGAVTAALNGNATLFGGIRDNNSAENDRTNLNALSTTSIVSIITDDAANDELELTWQRAALTGFAEAAQNSNATTSAEPIITYSASANMSAERVLSSGHMTTVDLGTAAQAQVDIADMAAGTVIGKQIDAATGAPVALTGAEQGENVQFTTIVVDSTTTGTVAAYSFAAPSNALVFQNVTVTVQGIVARPSGTLIWLRHTGTGTTTLVHQSGSALSADTISTGGADIVLTNTMQALLLYTNGRWRVYGVSHGTRPPFTGAISAPANTFATLFAGIRDNGSAENDRTNLNFLSTTSVVSTITDDSVGDELEITLERAALTGDITAAQNVNTTAFRSFSALSVLARAANSAGIPTELAATAATDAVLRESGGALSFGTVATGGIANDAVTNAKLANMAAGTVKGLQVDASGPADPVDLTGAEVGELLRFATTQDATITVQQDNFALNADANVLRLTPTTVGVTVTGITGGSAGRLLLVENVASAGNTFIFASLSASSLTANRIRTPNGASLVLAFRESALLRWDTGNGDWRVVAIARAVGVNDADYGDVTVSGAGTVWTVDTNIAKAWTGVHSFTAATFTVTTTGLTSISGDDVTLTAADDLSLISTNDNITLTANGVTGDIIMACTTTIIGTAGAGNVTWTATAGDINLNGGDDVNITAADNVAITTGAVSRIIYEPDGSWNIGGSNGTTGLTIVSAGSAAPPAWGQLPTAGIADAAVTLAKQANLAQATVIGRAEGAGTGVPQALTPTQVIAIVDGESPTWTGSHTFNGTDFAVNAGGAISVNGGGNVSLTATADIILTPGSEVEVDGSLALLGRVRLANVIQPSVLTADQNNYNPSGWATANVVRLGTDGTAATTRDITGALAGSDGEIKYLVNLGPGDVRLQYEHASSTAANRFLFGSLTTYTLDLDDMVGIWYDGDSNRWRVLSGISSS